MSMECNGILLLLFLVAVSSHLFFGSFLLRTLYLVSSPQKNIAKPTTCVVRLPFCYFTLYCEYEDLDFSACYLFASEEEPYAVVSC